MDEMAAELRWGAGAEWLGEAEEDERLAELLRRRRLRLGEAVERIMAHGDGVVASRGSLRIRGRLLAVGEDFATIDSGERVADVRLDAIRLRIDPSAEGGDRSVTGGSRTLKARLAEAAAWGGQVEIRLRSDETVPARVTVVAADHIEAVDDDDGVSFVPISQIVAVIWPDPSQ